MESKLKLASILFVLCQPFCCISQTTFTDTTFINESIAGTFELYEKYIQGQQAYYTGSAYHEPEQTSDEHPFFASSDWSPGHVNIGGHYYESIPLLYDLLSDLVITESVGKSFQALPSEKINSFGLSGHLFTRIENANFENSLPRSGFYDVLYDGPTRVVALRQKFTYKRTSTTEGVVIRFVSKNKYYLLDGKKFFQIKKRKSVLRLLSDQKQSLRSFLNKNRKTLKGKANREKMYAAAAAQYDNLTRSTK